MFKFIHEWLTKHLFSQSSDSAIGKYLLWMMRLTIKTLGLLLQIVISSVLTAGIVSFCIMFLISPNHVIDYNLGSSVIAPVLLLGFIVVCGMKIIIFLGDATRKIVKKMRTKHCDEHE